MTGTEDDDLDLPDSAEWPRRLSVNAERARTIIRIARRALKPGRSTKIGERARQAVDRMYATLLYDDDRRADPLTRNLLAVHRYVRMMRADGDADGARLSIRLECILLAQATGERRFLEIDSAAFRKQLLADGWRPRSKGGVRGDAWLAAALVTACGAFELRRVDLPINVAHPRSDEARDLRESWASTVGALRRRISQAASKFA